MFRRIVVGADGSPEGMDAAALGAAIAAATGSGLTLLDAFSPYPVSGTGMDRRTQVRAAERQLNAERRRFAPYAHIEVVSDPDPARALLRNARHWHADLVVIGSSRRAAAERCSIGQTGRRLLRKMPPALAIAKRGFHEQSSPELRSIAVGYDGGPESERALQLADQLAAAMDAELSIHTVNRDPIPTLRRGDSVSAEFLQEIREGARLGAMRIAERAAARTAARSSVNPAVGEPALVLTELSACTDVMVIGSRRWGPLARVLLGGVGEALATDCGASLIIASRPSNHRSTPSRRPHADPRTTPTSTQDPGARTVL